MASSIADAISDEELKTQERIEMLSGWVKLMERNASSKEKFLFAKKYGFVSENHMNLWINKSDEYETELEEFEEIKFHLSKEELIKRKRNLDRLRIASDLMKEKSTYRFYMRRLGKKEFSPYGEDLLKENFPGEDSNTANVDIERTIKNGYVSWKR